MTIRTNLRKYGVLQVLILGVFGGYVLGFSFGLQMVTNLSPQGTSPPEFVTIHLIIQSSHSLYPLDFSNTSVIPANRTLIDHLNRTIGPDNWSGEYFEIGGWLIQEIFSVSAQGAWHWLIYYRVTGAASWKLSPVGASGLQLNQDYDIKFLFQDG